MKSKLLTIIAAFGALGSMNAFATPVPTPTASDSWDTIRTSSELAWIGQGAFADAFGPMGFFNACVSGDNLLSIAPVKYCAASHYADNGDGMGGTHFVCDTFDAKNVVLARAQVVKEIVGYGNTGMDTTYPIYANVNVTIPTTQTFDVYLKSQLGGDLYGNGMFAFKKDYSISNCVR